MASLASVLTWAMGMDTDGGHFGSQEREVSMFDDQGTEQRSGLGI